MAFDIRLLDGLEYDDAEPLLQDYLEGVVEQFAESPEGQAYGADHPELGGWIATFTEIAYLYGGFTLPKMTKTEVATVMEAILPRKVTLLNPSEAEEAIPELIAFWNFLKRAYKFRSAGAIAKYLTSIQDKFSSWMFDPARGGMAKSFLMQGMQAGFDMTTQEGLEAFQQQYNQQRRESGSPPPGFLGIPMPPAAPGQNPLAAYPIPEGVPPEFVALLSQQLGYGAMPGLEHLPSDPEQLAEAIAQHLIDSGEVTLKGEAAQEDETAPDSNQPIQAELLRQDFATEEVEIPDDVAAQLQQLTITETYPGTILKDFETLLEVMGDRGLPVSGKLCQLSMKVLQELNDQMSRPIQTDLKRPQQKSYANLHGLYLLLRATGLGEVSVTGKTSALKRNADIFAIWQTLNPTEKYLTLLEAWLVRGHSELLGDDRSLSSEGIRVLQTWPTLMKKNQTFKNYNEQMGLSYWPGLHNVALLEMFGWVDIQSDKPEAGKGWRIKKLKPLPLGNAFTTVAVAALMQKDFCWDAESDFTQPWGELQPYFQPYFPEWKHNIPAQPAPEHQTGTFIFKVSLGKIWRRLAISSEAMMEDLAALIRHSVDFDSDHLDMFTFKNSSGLTVRIGHPALDDVDQYTDEVALGDLPLKPGSTMTYLFDFGDHWEFQVLLEEIQPGASNLKEGKVLEQRGEAPEQYATYDWNE